MKKGGAALLFVLLSATQPAIATPLRMDYSVENLGTGRYNYEFALVLDNHDGSWVAGQGWRWLIFGDAPGESHVPLDLSPLTDFVLDETDLPVGPWTAISESFGSHNGPTFADVLDFWTPNAVGETLRWSGTSTANLLQGELLFSTNANTTSSGLPAEFEVANRIAVAQVPEPATHALMALGLAALFAAPRQRARRA